MARALYGLALACVVSKVIEALRVAIRPLDFCRRCSCDQVALGNFCYGFINRRRRSRLTAQLVAMVFIDCELCNRITPRVAAVFDALGRSLSSFSS